MIAEREPERVTGHETYRSGLGRTRGGPGGTRAGPCVLGGEPFGPRPEHAQGEVARDAGRPRGGERHRRGAGARREVEDVLAGPGPDRLRDDLAPPPVLAE